MATHFDLGAGNDTLTVDGTGNNTVIAGDGNDTSASTAMATTISIWVQK